MPKSHPSLLQQKNSKDAWDHLTPLKKSLKPTSLSFITISIELDKTKNLLLTITYEELAKPIHRSITEKLWLKY